MFRIQDFWPLANEQCSVTVNIFNARPDPVVLQEKDSGLGCVRIENAGAMVFEIFVSAPYQTTRNVTRREPDAVLNRRCGADGIEFRLQGFAAVNSSDRNRPTMLLLGEKVNRDE